MNVFQSVYVVLPTFISETVQPGAMEKVAVTLSTCMHLPPEDRKPSSIVPDEDVVNMTSKWPPGG